jgi:hypothetical protein
MAAYQRRHYCEAGGLSGSMPIRSLTAKRNFCLQPRYRKCAAAHLRYLDADLALKERALSKADPQASFGGLTS